jgi:hypothetical protein
MKRVTMTVTYSEETAHQTHRQLMRDSPASRSDLLVWGPMLDVTSLSWFDADRDAVRDLLDGVDAVSDVALVPGDAGTYAFVDRSEHEFEREVLSLVSGAQVVFVPPLTFYETGELQFEAVGEQDRLSEFYRDLSELVDVRIDRVHTFRRRQTSASVTEKQRDALEAAVSAGYYEIPRTGSVEDVAAALDCAPSTAGELLRRAEAAVVQEFVGGYRSPGRT